MASTRKRLEALTAGLTMPVAAPPVERLPVRSESEGPPSVNADVETRFPPVAGRVAGPRTGPGQMIAFRGQIQQVEGEMASLRERLSQYEGSVPTRKLDPINIRPSRWANRHDASFKMSAFAGLKADIEHAGGNVQPILVKPLEKEPGQFEIVFGHRRHRACLELGIPVLASIWTDELGDAALFAAMDRENRQRADLSSYEQGLMYQRALEEQLFPTQRQLAEAVGVSHTWVRKALMVAQLPLAVVECFRSPLEISFRHAEQINAVMEKDQRGVLRRVEKLRGQGLAPATLVAKLLDAKVGFDKPEKIELQIAGKRAGSLVRSKGGELTLSISAEAATDATLEGLEAAIGEALRRIRTR